MVDLQKFKALDDDHANRLLLQWLSSDGSRAELFQKVNDSCAGALVFRSRDAAPRQPMDIGYDHKLKTAVPGHMPVTLVTERCRIKAILENKDGSYSSRVYTEFGGGNFMLALDPTATPAHADQRAAFRACFPGDPGYLKKLAQAACKAAGVTALQASEFDLADFARQAAVRLVQMLMGYGLEDFPVLDEVLAGAYAGLVHQVYERHFVTDPLVIPTARTCMGRLLTRTSALIDAYARRARGVPAPDTDDPLKGCQDPLRPDGFPPVLEKLGTYSSNLNGEQRAVIAVGAAVGTVGNVQAAVCIAMQGLFEDRKERWPEALRLARMTGTGTCPPDKLYEAWMKLLAPILRANPPIPFLPRLKVDTHGNKVEEYLLALGGGTWTGKDERDDPLVWGGVPGVTAHNCAGKELAWPLIVEMVRTVMSLPELAEALDPRNATKVGLRKRLGFACESYPLTYRLDRLRAQTSLNLAMRIRAPAQVNAVKLRVAISAGAPQIDLVLRQSRQVHFAWFELIDNDSVLVLHTVYDGPFGAYLQQFALQAGDLFDTLFQFIEDPPPMPVSSYPAEFAAHLLSYDRPPAAGYFFSAYPRSEVADITRREVAGP